MRQALRDSLGRRGHGAARYPRGSIVVCVSCGKPIYKLDRGIGAGERAGRSVQAFRPVSMADVRAIGRRRDAVVDPGIVAAFRAWTPAEVAAHVAALREPRAGDPMVCPVCGDVFARARASEVSDTCDRAYVIELVVLPPEVAWHG